MIRIGICDNDKSFVKQLRDMVSTACFSLDDIVITEFYDGREVIDYVQREEDTLDLLILDIYMEEMNGMATALYLRDQEIDIDIIFCTKSTQHILEGYRYKAYAYWLKPINYEMIRMDLERFFCEKERTSDFLHVAVRGTDIQIEVNQVMYFCSEGRKVIANLKNETIEFYGKLNEIERQVDNQLFVRCHQSYLVNRKYIQKHSKNELELKTNEIIPVSRKYGEQISITRSLAMNRESVGTMIFTEGEFVGQSARLLKGKVVRFGSEQNQCDYIFSHDEQGEIYGEIWYDYEEKDYIVKMLVDRMGWYKGEELKKGVEQHIYPCSCIELACGKNVIQFR